MLVLYLLKYVSRRNFNWVCRYKQYFLKNIILLDSSWRDGRHELKSADRDVLVRLFSCICGIGVACSLRYKVVTSVHFMWLVTRHTFLFLFFACEHARALNVNDSYNVAGNYMGSVTIQSSHHKLHCSVI